MILHGRDIVKSVWYDIQQVKNRIVSCEYNGIQTLPYNIASYAILLLMLCEVSNLKPGTLYGNLGCTHIYENHIEQLKMQVGRDCRELPKMNLQHRDNIEDFVYEDFELIGYEPYPHIKMDVAV